MVPTFRADKRHLRVFHAIGPSASVTNKLDSHHPRTLVPSLRITREIIESSNTFDSVRSAITSRPGGGLACSYKACASYSSLLLRRQRAITSEPCCSGLAAGMEPGLSIWSPAAAAVKRNHLECPQPLHLLAYHGWGPSDTIPGSLRLATPRRSVLSLASSGCLQTGQMSLELWTCN